jgi:hypothetical protein
VKFQDERDILSAGWRPPAGRGPQAQNERGEWLAAGRGGLPPEDHEHSVAELVDQRSSATQHRRLGVEQYEATGDAVG